MSLVKVLPGNVTDIFYIMVCNLPWNCSWQRLKDFAKNQQPDGACIEIDHAHVYPDGTTSGWVRVKGRENFVRAMAHLTTGIFDHRSLVVDGRNETEVTPIKEDGFVGCGTHRRARNDSSSSCSTNCNLFSPKTSFYNHRNNSSVSMYSGSEGWYAQPYAGTAAPSMSSTSPNVSYYQQLPQVYGTYSPAQAYSTVDYFQAPAPSGAIFAGNMVTTTPLYVTPVQRPILYTYPAPALYAETPFSPPTPASTTKNEARKIIITQLPYSVSYHNLEKLLLKYITRSMPRSSQDSPDSQLEELNIPIHADKKTSLGHAFAVLRSEQLARSVVKNINGLSFHGRVINAHLSKEGVGTSIQFAQSSDSHLMSPPSDTTYQAYQEGQGALVPSTRERESAVEYMSTRPPATPGTRNDNKSSRKTKESSHDRKKKGISPAVVDGSSTGSSRDRDVKFKKYRS